MKQIMIKQKAMIIGLLCLFVALVSVVIILQINKKETKVESYPNATFCFETVNYENK